MAAELTHFLTSVRVLRRLMGATAFRHGVATAILAAFIALFALLPVFDAAACASEPAAAASVDSLADTPSTDHPDGYATCSHGHCHHGGGIVVSGIDVSAVADRHDQRGLAPQQPLVSRTPAGPDRPPRG